MTGQNRFGDDARIFSAVAGVHPRLILSLLMKTNLMMLMILVRSLGITEAGLAQTNVDSVARAQALRTEALVPRIQFAQTEFDFVKIQSGEIVKHDFVFTNVGTATLEIEDV